MCMLTAEENDDLLFSEICMEPQSQNFRIPHWWYTAIIMYNCTDPKHHANTVQTSVVIYFLYHSDEWWRDIWPLPSVHLCRPERVGCHQPCWLALWKTTINNVTALINTYYLDQHACWWEPWPSPGYHGNTQGREECLQPHSLQLRIQANCGLYNYIES